LASNVNVRAAYSHSYYDMEWRATGQGGTGLIAQSFIDIIIRPVRDSTSADAMYRRNRWEHQWGGERSGQIDITATSKSAASKFVRSSDIRIISIRASGHAKNNPNVAAIPTTLSHGICAPGHLDRSVPFGLSALLLASNNESRSDGSSLYGVLSVGAFDDRLQVVGGYARHKLHNDPTLNFLNNTATAATDRAANVPQAGALFKITREISLFASYSESFLANNRCCASTMFRPLC